MNSKFIAVIFYLLVCLSTTNTLAQTPPNALDVTGYKGLFKAVIDDDIAALKTAIANADEIDIRDNYYRTPLHVATYYANHGAMRLLVKAGADANALESDRYDMVTIAAVADDLETMKLALKLGNKADNITSRYDGTALIAAAHLGHVEVVKTLISAGAPLDHVNNLQWTAVIEAIVLGDGGEDHTATLKALVDAGANVNIRDGRGNSPLTLAQQHGYSAMIKILRDAGARN